MQASALSNYESGLSVSNSANILGNKVHDPFSGAKNSPSQGGSGSGGLEPERNGQSLTIFNMFSLSSLSCIQQV